MIDWRKVWKSFDMWIEAKDTTCDKCYQHNKNYPEWADQQKKIRQLVENQLKESARGK